MKTYLIESINIQKKHLRYYVFLTLSLIFAFILLPTYSLNYGLFDSTQSEIRQSMAWSDINIAWLWFILPFINLIGCYLIKSQKIRNLFNLFFAIATFLFVFLTAYLYELGIGYGGFYLLLILGLTATVSLSELDYLGGDKFIIGSLMMIIFLIVVFVIYPSVAIFIPMFIDENGGWQIFQFWDILTKSYILRIIANSAFLGISVAIGSTFFGLILAIYTTRIAKRSAFLARIFSILPIVTPPFVVGLGVTLMLGKSGYITNLMATYFGLEETDWLYGFTGIWLAQVLAFAPMSFMILDGAMKALHPSLEEASYTLRANKYQTFFKIVMPLLKPALANSFLIIFMQSLADFSNPLVLGGSFDVIATQIYFYIVGAQLDYASASTLGSILLVFSLAIFILQYMWIGKRSYVTVSGKSYRGEVQDLPSIVHTIVCLLLYLWIGFNVLLYGSIFFGSFTINWGVDYTLTFDNYLNLFGQGMSDGAWPSLITTIIYAAIAAPITALLGLLIAYVVVRQQFYGKKIIEFSTMLCFAVPGTVAGVSYILAFNQAPLYLTGTASIVIISMVMRNVPVGIRSGIAGLGQLDKSLDEASLSLRANSLKTIRYILLPLLRPAILSTSVYSFVRAMTTVSAIVFLVTPETRVATSYILNRVEDGEYGIAIAYGSVLIVVMMSIILLFDAFVGESRTSKSKSKNN